MQASKADLVPFLVLALKEIYLKTTALDVWAPKTRLSEDFFHDDQVKMKACGLYERLEPCENSPEEIQIKTHLLHFIANTSPKDSLGQLQPQHDAHQKH